MNTAITKIKDGVITLPKRLQKSWKGAIIYIDAAQDAISIKRISKPNLNFKEMLDAFADSARKTKLSQKEVRQVLKEVRKK